jgi:hypothetical protein
MTPAIARSEIGVTTFSFEVAELQRSGNVRVMANFPLRNGRISAGNTSDSLFSA